MSMITRVFDSMTVWVCGIAIVLAWGTVAAKSAGVDVSDAVQGLNYAPSEPIPGRASGPMKGDGKLNGWLMRGLRYQAMAGLPHNTPEAQPLNVDVAELYIPLDDPRLPDWVQHTGKEQALTIVLDQEPEFPVLIDVVVSGPSDCEQVGAFMRLRNVHMVFVPR